jgi:hypothetical protein
MARRRKRKVVSHRRRRRVGALALNASSPMVTYGSIILGFLAGGAINPLINSLIPATMKTQVNTGKMVAGGQVGIGALLVFSKGKKSLVKTLAGGLMLGAGLKRASIVFKPGTTDTLGGYGRVPVVGAYETQGQLGYGGRRKVAGYGDVPVVGSYTTPGALNGARVMGSMRSDGNGSTLMG